MTGSIAIDVVIGLAFLYLLYSLFATIVMEIIATWLSLRARHLKRSIKRMLVDDEFQSKYRILNNKLVAYLVNLYHVVSDYIGFVNRDLRKQKSLFYDFYDQPSIKYLSRGGLFNKPSYLTAQNFSKALLDTIKQGQSDPNPLTQVQNGIESITSNTDTKVHLMSLLNDANNDLQKFKLLLENWFEDTQERSIGWFKRNTQTWLLVIGMIIAVFMKADTLAIVQKLSVDPDARQQLVEMAIAAAEVNEKRIKDLEQAGLNNESLKDQKDSLLQAQIDTLKMMGKQVNNDINKAHGLLAIDWNIPKRLPLHHKKLTQDSLGKSSRLYPLTLTIVSSQDEDSIKRQFFIEVDTANLDLDILPAALPDEVSVDDLKAGLPIHQICYKFKYVFKNKSLSNWGFLWPPNYFRFENLLGFLITALAISLGAPFWFDLLNKLIKLRSSVAQPARTQANTKDEQSDQSILNRVG